MSMVTRKGDCHGELQRARKFLRYNILIIVPLLRFASLITHRNRVRQEGFRQEVQMNVNRVLRVQLARRELLVAPPVPLVPPVDT